MFIISHSWLLVHISSSLHQNGKDVMVTIHHSDQQGMAAVGVAGGGVCPLEVGKQTVNISRNMDQMTAAGKSLVPDPGAVGLHWSDLHLVLALSAAWRLSPRNHKSQLRVSTLFSCFTIGQFPTRGFGMTFSLGGFITLSVRVTNMGEINISAVIQANVTKVLWYKLMLAKQSFSTFQYVLTGVCWFLCDAAQILTSPRTSYWFHSITLRTSLRTNTLSLSLF